MGKTSEEYEEERRDRENDDAHERHNELIAVLTRIADALERQAPTRVVADIPVALRDNGLGGRNAMKGGDVCIGCGAIFLTGGGGILSANHAPNCWWNRAP